MEFFRYDPGLAKEALALIPDKSGSLAPMDALKEFTEINHELLASGEFMKFFYGLLALRKHHPGLSLPPDLALLAANAMLASNAGNVRLLDWELLPAAILLAGAGMGVALPHGDVGKLGMLLKATAGHESILGCDLEKCLQRCQDSPEELEGGILITSRDILTSIKATDCRERLLKAGMVKKILQLPKPKRQNCNIYPVLIELGKNDGPIHLAKIISTNPGPGGLDQEACIDALDKKGGNGSLFSQEEALRTGRLMPPENTDEGIELRKLADVFRCQLPRKKATEDKIEPKNHSGILLCQELALGDFDPLTGFINDKAGTESMVDIRNAGHRMMKGFLQKGDILLVFRGAEKTLGRACLYLREKGDTVANRAFCVIRARHGISPVWLYHELRKEKHVKAIRAAGSGKDTLIVSLDDIRDLVLDAPDPERTKEVEARHAIIVEKTARIRELRKEIEEEMKSISQGGIQ